MLPGSTCRSGCTCHDASDAVLEKHGVVPALRNERKEEYSVAVDTRRPVSGDTVDPAGVGRRCI
jgi:hypothetical protein